MSLTGCHHETPVSIDLRLAVLPFFVDVKMNRYQSLGNFQRKGTNVLTVLKDCKHVTNPCCFALLRPPCWEQTWARWPDGERERGVLKLALYNNPFPRKCSVETSIHLCQTWCFGPFGLSSYPRVPWSLSIVILETRLQPCGPVEDTPWRHQIVYAVSRHSISHKRLESRLGVSYRV